MGPFSRCKMLCIMLKRLEMFVLLGAMATAGHSASQTAPLSPPKQGIAEADHGQRGNQHTDSNNAKSSAQDTFGASGQPASKTSDVERQNERENLSVQWKIAWFTEVLAAVGILQGAVLFLTWRTIRRQANLQKFLTRQWVDVGDWGVGGDDPRRYGEWDTPFSEPPRKDEELRDSMEISLHYEVLNNTPLPLGLHKIVTGISKGGKGINWETHEVVADTILPPPSAEKDNSYACFVPISLTKRDVELYAVTCLGFQVKVEVSFLNAEGAVVTQQFVRWAAGGVRGYSFNRDSGKRPTRKQQQDEQTN
jgi:hypothetical protein